MKIWHVTNTDNVAEIRESGTIKATPQWVRTYDDNGQEIDIIEDRAYYCEDEQSAVNLKEVMEYWREGALEIVELDAEEIHNPVKDSKTPEGWFSKKNIKLK
jgi:glutathionylspermidine synthase